MIGQGELHQQDHKILPNISTLFSGAPVKSPTSPTSWARQVHQLKTFLTMIYLQIHTCNLLCIDIIGLLSSLYHSSCLPVILPFSSSPALFFYILTLVERKH